MIFSKSLNVECYKRIETGVQLDNPEVIPILLQLRWYGLPVAEKMHLQVSHPQSTDRSANIITTKFHGVLWDDVDDSDTASFRRARLRLKGVVDKKIIYALLEDVKLDDLLYAKITFSPVPFGIGGRPQLTKYKKEQLDLLLRVAKMILSSSDSAIWSERSLAKEMARRGGAPDYEFDEHDATFFLGELAKLALVESYSPRSLNQKLLDITEWKPQMTSSRFEEVFGVKLPKL